MKKAIAGLVGTLVVMVSLVAIMVPVASSASSPSFVMTDNFGFVFSLHSSAATNGTQNWAGTVDTGACGIWNVTATKKSTKGVWNWRFVATNPLGSGDPVGCAGTFTYVGSGTGTLSGTWTNDVDLNGTWTSDTTKGAGTPPDAV